MRRAWWMAGGAGLLALAAGACHTSGETTSTGVGGSASSSTASASATAGSSASASTGTGGSTIAACNRGMPEVCNTVGVDLAQGTLTDDAYWSLITTTLAVPFYQPGAIFLDAGGACARCAAATQHGRDLVLVARAGGSEATATAPPADLEAYKAQLGAALDAHPPAAVVIEGELDTLYSGSAEEYLAELTAGCAVAHQKGVRCADGGHSSATVVLLLVDYYEHLGNTGAALHLATVASDDPGVVSAFASWPPTTEQDVTDALAGQKATLDRAKAIIAGERAAGVDYANFHWYDQDTDSFDVAVAFTRTLTGCNAVMTGALGQRGQDPIEATHKLSDAHELGLSLVVWSSTPSYAAPPVDTTGALLPSGMSLQTLSGELTCGG